MSTNVCVSSPRIGAAKRRRGQRRSTLSLMARWYKNFPYEKKRSIFSHSEKTSLIHAPSAAEISTFSRQNANPGRAGRVISMLGNMARRVGRIVGVGER